MYVVAIKEGEVNYLVQYYSSPTTVFDTVIAENTKELKDKLEKVGYKLLEVWK